MTTPAQQRALIRLRTDEERLEKAVRRALRATFDQTLEAAGEDALPSRALVAAITGPDDFRGLLTFWREQVNGPLAASILSVYRSNAVAQVKTLSKQYPWLRAALGPNFFSNIRNVRADLFLAQRENLIVGVGQSLFDNIASEMRESLEAGEGVPKAANRVRAAMGDSLKRARVIARTEAGSAVNAADSAVADELELDGIVAGRTWLATEDDRTRPSHMEADGQTVYGQDRFLVGGVSMRHPSDPSAPAREVINCRCTMTLVLKD